MGHGSADEAARFVVLLRSARGVNNRAFCWRSSLAARRFGKGAQDKPLSALVKPYMRYSQSGEINFQVEDKDAKIRELAEHYKKAQIDYLDGVTIDHGDWWFNVRKSNTEPLLRLNLETDSKEKLDQKLAELKKILGEPVHGH